MTAHQPTGTGASQAMVAGSVCAIVGFTSSFAVALTGLHAVGASADQAASGLMVLCALTGLGCVLFSWRTRIPVTMTAPAGGFATAVGAFVVSGVLIALCGLVRSLERLVEAIPPALASAMLAGVLLAICSHPFVDLRRSPAAIGAVLVAWVIGYAVWRRWAVVASFAAALVVMGVDGSFSHVRASEMTPQFVVVTPHADMLAMLTIGVPLFLVTMTSQNVPGISVLASFGYRLGLRGPLRYTGAASAIGAFAGAHAVNLAAISAALAPAPMRIRIAPAGGSPASRAVRATSCSHPCPRSSWPSPRMPPRGC